MLDVSTLCRVLGGTFEADSHIRQEAEKVLEQFERLPLSLSVFLQLLMSADVPLPILQSCSLRLKNVIQEKWNYTDGEDMVYPPESRVCVYTQLFPCILHLPVLIRPTLLQIVKHIYPVESPAKWTNILPDIYATITASPVNWSNVFAALETLRYIVRCYQFKEEKMRAPLYELVAKFFPIMQQVMEQAAKGGEAHWHVMRICVKTFYYATQLSLPPLFTNFPAIQPFLDMMLTILNTAAPTDSVNHPFHKVQKWSALIGYRLFARFGRVDYVGDKKDKNRKSKKDWASKFMDAYAAKYLNTFFAVLQAKLAGKQVLPRVIQLAYLYISTAIGLAALYKPLIQPHLPFLIQSSILQCLCLTTDDIQMWRDDPHEFVRRSLDLMEEFQDPRVAAVGLLVELIQLRTRDTLKLATDTVAGVMDQYAKNPNPQSMLMKEGALRMFGSLKKLLLAKSEFRAPIESLIVHHVFPEFASPQGFMRARAAWVIGRFSKMKWSNEEHHAQSVRLVAAGLTDTELPVKLEAWAAMSKIIRHEKVLEFVKPSFGLIIEQFFYLFDELGNEEVVSILSTLIDRFGPDIAPHAIRLLTRLKDLYLSLLQADNDDDEAASSALQCVRCINAILYALETRKEMHGEVAAICHEVIINSFNEECIEFYEDILEMIACITYFADVIQPYMWEYVLKICESWHAWANDFIQNMTSPLDNYINKAPDMFARTDQPFLQAVYSIPKTILSDLQRMIDAPQACILLQSILANCRFKVDALLPEIIQLVGQRFLSIPTKKKKKKAGKNVKKKIIDDDDDDAEEILSLKFSLLEVISVCAWYNPALFLQVLSAAPKQFMPDLFNHWLSHLEHMNGCFQTEKLCVLGLSSLCLVPFNTLPPLLSQAFPSVLFEIERVLSSMAEELAQEEEEEQEEDEDGEALFHDVDGDKDAYEEGVDSDVDVGENEDAMNGEIDDFLDSFDGGFGGEQAESYVSPLDDVDAFVFFAQSIQELAQREPNFYQQWTKSIGSGGQKLLQSHMELAAKHAAEIQQEKQKELEEKSNK